MTLLKVVLIVFEGVVFQGCVAIVALKSRLASKDAVVLSTTTPFIATDTPLLEYETATLYFSPLLKFKL